MLRSALALPLWTNLLLTAAEGPAVAEDRILRITKADCARLVKHEPAPDVAYQPGVDAHGRPVVPADLNGMTLRLPETLAIAITVDLQERFGIPKDSALYESEAQIGVVTVDGDRIAFNGQLLVDPEVLALAEACRRSGSD